MNGRCVTTRPTLNCCTAPGRSRKPESMVYEARWYKALRCDRRLREFKSRHTPHISLEPVGEAAVCKTAEAGSVPARDSKGTIDTEGRDSDLAGPISRLYRGSTGLRHHRTVIPRRPSVRR